MYPMVISKVVFQLNRWGRMKNTSIDVKLSHLHRFTQLRVYVAYACTVYVTLAVLV
jgi:hypothetical protein